MTPRVVLASASPRRADILRQLGLDPEVRPADVDETVLDDESPHEHVERLARVKAETVAASEPEALVLGGDTVVVNDGHILGKPSGPADARRMLAGLSGSTHHVLSGLALTGPHGTVSGVANTTVRMRPFDAETVRAYVDGGEPLDKAGAYGIQGKGAALVAGIEGDYFAVVGFPVAVFVELLERAGWRFHFGSLTPKQ